MRKGPDALSKAQLQDVLLTGKRYDAYRGTWIDGRVRQMVGQDPTLSKLLVGQSNNGVDFTNILTSQRYDMTTARGFPAHVEQYGNLPTPLIHLDTTQQ